MVLPSFGRTGAAPEGPAQNQQQPAQQPAQQQEDPIEWERGWKMPENTGFVPAIQEGIFRIHGNQGIGKKRNQRYNREFLVLNFDWFLPIVVREGMNADPDKNFQIEIPMSGVDGSGMGMFRQSVAHLTGIAATNDMLLEKLYEFQDNGLMLHLVSVDAFVYGVNQRTGDVMKGMIWQLVDLYQEGDDGTLYSIPRKVAVPEPQSMFEAVNEAVRALAEENEEPEQQQDSPAPTPVQAPDFSQYDWTEEHGMASGENGVSWTILRSAIREKYKNDSRMVNALFTESGGFQSAVLEYFLVNDIMRKISEDPAPVQVIAVQGALG